LYANYQPVEWDILRFAYHRQRDDHKQRDDEGLPFAESWSNTTSMGLENEFNLIKNLSVVGGVSWDSFKVQRAESANYDKNGNFTFMSTTNPGVTKYDWNPMGGLTYQVLPDTRIFTSVARKSRYPTLSELFSSKGGNPALQAEHSVNTTVGIDQSFGKFAWAQVSYFYHDVQNWITRSGPNKTDPNMNIGKVTMQGFELNTEFYLPIKDLVLTFDYMYDLAHDASEGRVTNRVTYIPLHSFDAGLRYIVPRIGTRLDFNATYIGQTYTTLPTLSAPSDKPVSGDSQMTFDCRVSQKFMKYFEAYVAMNNMLDRYYVPETGYPAQGRSFWCGLTAKF
jgi:outer membrane receptor protein involved in Fe transport